MFESLSSRFEGIFRSVRARGRLGLEDIDEILGEIRIALIEADVNLRVVRTLVDRIRDRAVGRELSGVLNPAQQVIKIVLEELTRVLGGEKTTVTFASSPPTVVLLVGLQGAGKTTTAAKLAAWFKTQGGSPFLIAADLARPAAVEQLVTLGSRIDVSVYSSSGNPVRVADEGLNEAVRLGHDVVICDSAGRLALDAQLMDEISQISTVLNPDYTFMVVDSLTGQDAVNVAEAFHSRLELDGVVLTKLDGDSRGGAALSISEVVGRPVVFATTGEGIQDLEIFHPDRMASRILGMGDVETLIEKAEQAFRLDQTENVIDGITASTFNLDDLVAQLRQLRQMGPVGNLLKMLPGISGQMQQTEVDESRIDRMEAIVNSMTLEERTNPDVIGASRRARIANGSGTKVEDVRQLVTQFGEMRKLMKQMDGFDGGRRDKRSRQGKKSARKRRGGRTTPSGSITPVKRPLALPGLGGEGSLDKIGFPEIHNEGRFIPDS